MARIISYVFGAILAVVGVWGFVQNPVFGIFPANSLHSIIHLVTGLVLLVLPMWWPGGISLGLKVFGVIYAVVAVLGFIVTGDNIFGLIDNSTSDGILHILLAVVFLWAGFMSGDESPAMESSAAAM